jgi:excinuclease ABC subunit C
MASLAQKLENVPHSPGVYLYYSKDKRIIYVGKAKDLKNRVSSYFVSTYKGPKTEALVKQIVDIDIIVVRSEVEAFLLEAELIKRYKPKYNIDLKDDKSYLHIVFQDYEVEFQGQKYTLTRVFPTRNKNLKRATYFGPYPSDAQTVKRALKAFRRVFPFCDYTKTKLLQSLKQGRGCLYFHIGLCPGPCADVKNIEENQKNIRQMKQFMSKGYTRGIEDLQAEMAKYAASEDYEKALEIRTMIEKIFRLETSHVLPKEYISNPNLMEDIYKRRMDDIAAIFGIETPVKRVECYDISNIMGEWATGSMVVSENGHLEKSQYRKFRIKYTKGITDFGMMTEVMKRRSKNDWPRPDLFLIDGGKGQVSVVLKVLEQTEFKDIPVAGIFKPNDFFLVRRNGKWKVIKPHKDNAGYLHLRELRDEAHRFAKGYHKKLRRELKLNS